MDPCRRSDCAHTCTRNGDSSFLCSCERGFSLASDRRSCQRSEASTYLLIVLPYTSSFFSLAVDPCDRAGCSHRCIANGFIATCACNQGFALRADKKSCSRGEVSEIAFSITNNLKKMNSKSVRPSWLCT